MAKPFNETDEFKQLNAFWRKKLEESGFKDAEQDDGNLKQWTSHYFKVRHTGVRAEAKEMYYRRASQFLHEHAFKTDQERSIWELHASGLSIRGIARKLQASVWLVSETIRKISLAMKQTITTEQDSDE